MSNSSTKIEQINFIDKLLSKGGHYTIQKISENMELYSIRGGTSVPSVYRLIKEMKEKMKAPIVKDEENAYYYEADNTVMLPGFIARADNLHSLSIVKNLLETIKDTPIYNDAEKVFSELSLLAPSKNSFDNSDNAPARVMFLGAPATSIGDKIWNTIFDAMEKNCHIVIEYDMQTEIIKRGIQPYQLIFDNGIWDLWGYDCIKKRRQLYNLNRIKSVDLSPEPFSLPADYDFRKETPGTFGCYRDLENSSMTFYKIFFKKNSYAGIFSKDRVWGENQLIEETDDGMTISFYNNQFLPILRWVLGWGSDVRPVEPAALVEEWKKEINKMWNEISLK